MSLQKRYDQLLMVAWENENNLGWVLWKMSQHLETENINAAVEIMQTNGVDRLFDKNGRVNQKIPVRAFVSSACNKLSNKLWDGYPTIIAAMELDEYKWKKYKPNRAFARRERKRKMIKRFGYKKLGNHKYQKHGKLDWGTVS